MHVLNVDYFSAQYLKSLLGFYMYVNFWRFFSCIKLASALVDMCCVDSIFTASCS